MRYSCFSSSRSQCGVALEMVIMITLTFLFTVGDSPPLVFRRLVWPWITPGDDDATGGGGTSSRRQVSVIPQSCCPLRPFASNYLSSSFKTLRKSHHVDWHFIFLASSFIMIIYIFLSSGRQQNNTAASALRWFLFPAPLVSPLLLGYARQLSLHRPSAIRLLFERERPVELS